MERDIKERIDMLPACKNLGFFTDAYCAEWAYAKAVLIRKITAKALADKITDGQLKETSALRYAKDIMYQSAYDVLKFRRN